MPTNYPPYNLDQNYGAVSMIADNEGKIKEELNKSKEANPIVDNSKVSPAYVCIVQRVLVIHSIEEVIVN